MAKGQLSQLRPPLGVTAAYGTAGMGRSSAVCRRNGIHGRHHASWTGWWERRRGNGRTTVCDGFARRACQQVTVTDNNARRHTTAPFRDARGHAVVQPQPFYPAPCRTAARSVYVPRSWHSRTVSPVSRSTSLGAPPTAPLSSCGGAGGRPTSTARRRCRRRHRCHRRRTGTQRREHPRAAAATPPPRNPPLRDGGPRRRRRTALPTDTTPSLDGCGSTAMVVGAVSPCIPPLDTLRCRADPASGRGRHTAGTAASRSCRHRCRRCPREHHRREPHHRHRQSTTPTPSSVRITAARTAQEP